MLWERSRVLISVSTVVRGQLSDKKASANTCSFSHSAIPVYVLHRVRPLARIELRILGYVVERIRKQTLES